MGGRREWICNINMYGFGHGEEDRQGVGRETTGGRGKAPWPRVMGPSKNVVSRVILLRKPTNVVLDI